MAPNATYLQRGEALDYRNTTETTIPHGTIVTIGPRIGVTGCDIPPGQLGTIHVCGVFRIKKTDAAAIGIGQTVYYDGTGITGQVSTASNSASVQSDGGAGQESGTTEDTAIEVGYAAADAAASDETVLVKISG
jgi:predicted RecA/RadA family phage recombinase